MTKMQLRFFLQRNKEGFLYNSLFDLTAQTPRKFRDKWF